MVGKIVKYTEFVERLVKLIEMICLIYQFFIVQPSILNCQFSNALTPHS